VNASLLEVHEAPTEALTDFGRLQPKSLPYRSVLASSLTRDEYGGVRGGGPLCGSFLERDHFHHDWPCGGSIYQGKIMDQSNEPRDIGNNRPFITRGSPVSIGFRSISLVFPVRHIAF